MASVTQLNNNRNIVGIATEDSGDLVVTVQTLTTNVIVLKVSKWSDTVKDEKGNPQRKPKVAATLIDMIQKALKKA